MSFQVVIVDSAQVPHSDDSIEQDILGDIAHVSVALLNSEEELAESAADIDGIILWHHVRLTSASIRLLQKTRIIVRNGVGFDNVDILAAKEAGIAVSNVPDYGTEEVADHTIALILALLRQIKPLMLDVARGSWEWKVALSCRRLSTQTLGLVGCGRIGTATALRAKALGLQVQIYDPYLPTGYEKAIAVRRVDTLAELLSTADVVSIHVPLTDETQALISHSELQLMKPSAYLVNTARGATVSHDALYLALQNGLIAGAALDVLEDEPTGAVQLSGFPNCIVTPHSAFYSHDSLIEMRTKSALTVRDALLHHRYRNVVNGVH